MGVFITIAGVLFTPLMVELMLGKDGSVYPYAKTYLIIYFAGVIGLMVYNIGAGILRAVGDSRHPFYFLVVSAVTNIVLDVLFVFGFGMDVDGVALATVIAQCLSAVLTVITLLRNDTWVKLIPKQLRIDKKILRQIFSIGLPAAIQMALTAFSNVFVQSYIGGVDGIPQKVALGAWTSYSKIDQLLFLPAQSLGLAITTFVGQNLGNGDIKRAKRGTNIAYLMATAASIVAIIPIIFFADGIAPVFNSTPEIAENAAMLLRYITPFYLFCCINQVYAAALRGAGHTKIPMVIMLSAFVGFRQIYLFIVSNYVSNTLMWLGMAYPAGWALNSTTVYLYYRFCNLGKFRITKKQSES
jgi:putative MATE family efflux protein